MSFFLIFPTAIPLIIVIDNNKKFPESENLLLDSEKSNLLLNWNPKFNFYETLEFTYDWYNCYLNKGGHFIAKYFRRGDLGQLLVNAKKKFTKVSSFKPNASRKNSSEIYLVCYQKK